MTYEELYLYVNNAYVQAYQNNLYGTEIVIKKEDYFSLLEICAEFDIRCYPFALGFNRILYDYSKDKENPKIHLSFIDGFEFVEESFLRVILEWDDFTIHRNEINLNNDNEDEEPESEDDEE